MDENVQNAQLLKELAQLRNVKTISGLRESIEREMQNLQSGFADIEKYKKEFYELLPILSQKDIDKIGSEIEGSERDLTKLQNELAKYLGTIDKVQSTINNFIESRKLEIGPYSRGQIKQALQNITFLPENLKTIINESSEHLAEQEGIIGEYGKYFQSVILGADSKGTVKPIPISQTKKDIEIDNLKKEIDAIKQQTETERESFTRKIDTIERAVTEIVTEFAAFQNSIKEDLAASRKGAGAAHDKEFRLFSHVISQINVELRELNNTIRQTTSEFHNFQKTLRAGSDAGTIGGGSTRKRKKKEETQPIVENPPIVEEEFIALPAPEDRKLLPPPKENLPGPYVGYWPERSQEYDYIYPGPRPRLPPGAIDLDSIPDAEIVEDVTQAKKTRRQKGESASEFNKEVVTLLKQILDAIKKQTEVDLRILNKIDSGGGRRSASEGGGGRSGGGGGGGGSGPLGGAGEEPEEPWWKRIGKTLTGAARDPWGTAERAMMEHPVGIGIVGGVAIGGLLWKIGEALYNFTRLAPPHLYDATLAASGKYFSTGLGPSPQTFMSELTKSFATPNSPAYGFSLERDMGALDRILFYTSGASGNDMNRDIQLGAKWLAEMRAQPSHMFSMTPEASTEYLTTLLSAGHANINEDRVEAILSKTTDILEEIRDKGYDQLQVLSSMNYIMQESYRSGAYKETSGLAMYATQQALNYGGAGASTGSVALSLAEGYKKISGNLGSDFNTTMAFMTSNLLNEEGLKKALGDKLFEEFKSTDLGSKYIQFIEQHPNPTGFQAYSASKLLRDAIKADPNVAPQIAEALFNSGWGNVYDQLGGGVMGPDLQEEWKRTLFGWDWTTASASRKPATTHFRMGPVIDATNPEANRRALEKLQSYSKILNPSGFGGEYLSIIKSAVNNPSLNLTYADILGVQGAEFNEHDLQVALSDPTSEQFKRLSKMGPLQITDATAADKKLIEKTKKDFGDLFNMASPQGKRMMEALEYMSEIIKVDPDAAQDVSRLEWRYNQGIGSTPPSDTEERISNNAARHAAETVNNLFDVNERPPGQVTPPASVVGPPESAWLAPRTSGNISELNLAVAQVVAVRSKLTDAMNGLVAALQKLQAALIDMGDDTHAIQSDIQRSLDLDKIRGANAP